MTERPAQREQGRGSEEVASLARAYCTVPARQTVGLARELLGGNRILLAEQVGRVVADAEAIHSREATREMNMLIVGRAITGLSAFVRSAGSGGSHPVFQFLETNR